jgi:hypothetical protein
MVISGVLGKEYGEGILLATVLVLPFLVQPAGVSIFALENIFEVKGGALRTP